MEKGDLIWYVKKSQNLVRNHNYWKNDYRVFHPRSTFQVANLPRSTGLVSILQTYLQAGGVVS